MFDDYLFLKYLWMVYKNYLTTPRGRYCEISDISNGDYLILLKYLQGEHYSAFFDCLNEIVKRDIQDFDDYDIVEKSYVYIAYCMYSIRGSISVINKTIGDQEVDISTILNNIEQSYVIDLEEKYKLSEDYYLTFKLPKRFFFQDGNICVDFYSGLVGFNEKSISQEEMKTLRDKLGTKQLAFIEDFLREKFKIECDLLSGVVMNQMNINIVNESMLWNIVNFFKMSLDNFYQIMYVVIKHLRMSYSDFMKISQVETNILLACAAEENKKMNSQDNNIPTIGRMMDELD